MSQMGGISFKIRSEMPSTPNLRQEALRLIRAKDWRGALGCIDRALNIEPHDAAMLIKRAQCLLALGRFPEACDAAAAAQLRAPPDPVLYDALGSLFSRANDQQRALSAYDRAVTLDPNNPHFIFNRATVYRFLGRLAEAEADYDRVIALKPADYEAYANRSELRTQSVDANHIGELEALIAQGISDWRGDVQVRHALAKEYEDIGDYAKSFQHLCRGAKKRREHMRYDVTIDVATVDWIIEAFPAAPDETVQQPGDAPDDAPIFIVGLPRSGSTLVDRILGSHSRVFSAGELDHFALCIVDAVRRRSGGAQLPRRELVARSADVDFAALGRDYLERARHTVAGDVRFTDKMPLNYLYCGLIQRALPNAKIVHVARRPMAACYAMYKAAIYPLSYEALVADQLGETRRLLDFCCLEWQDSCVEFHRNPSPTTTASAAQVRRPLYDSSVSQWRHYAAELEELSSLLSAAGISTEQLQ